ncbi:MAG: nucleotidyltransferase domain-containing protein [Cyanobacteria bacterium J06554_3]
MKKTHNTPPIQFGLKRHIIQQIVSVLKQHPEIESAILYGSRAMGNFRPGSDIDLTLTGDALNYRTVARVENEIDDLLLPYLFDISIFSHIENPNVVDHIQRVGITFYQRAAE